MNSRTRRLLITALMFLSSAQFVSAALGDKPSLVTAVEVVSQPLKQELPLSGSAEALQESLVSSRIDGVVETVFVREGEWIESGQKILALDTAIAELEVASAQARVNEALARYKDAKRQKEEFRSLKDRQHVAKTSLASAIAEEEVTKAALAGQRAELRRLKELLSRHTLVAPFSGVVAQKSVEVGQWVQTDTPAIKLVALDKVRVRASLPQHYYARVTKDSPIRVVFDSLSKQTFTGDLSTVVAVGSQSTRSFPVLIDLDNSAKLIAPGMSARIFVQLSGGESEALLLPRDAVVMKADGSRIVWRVQQQDDQTKVSPVTVSLGRAVGDQIEILESLLKPGDQVVLLGNESLRPGQAVKIADNSGSGS